MLARVQRSINNKREELWNSYTKEQYKAITVPLASHRRNHPQVHNRRWKKPDTTEYLLYNSISTHLKAGKTNPWRDGTSGCCTDRKRTYRSHALHPDQWGGYGSTVLEKFIKLRVCVHVSTWMVNLNFSPKTWSVAKKVFEHCFLNSGFITVQKNLLSDDGLPTSYVISYIFNLSVIVLMANKSQMFQGHLLKDPKSGGHYLKTRTRIKY